ncbi:MAG: cation:proton antiporter [candidate division Zixibacteria bacterium]|nr:cation:proton antiporter [candidate division Zixibacteria bacterium]
MENITQLLFTLFLIYSSAKLLGEIFERFKQSAVIGEILAGVILGPQVLNLIGTSEIFPVLAEIGVIILLFNVGLHTKVEEIMRVGKSSLVVAVLGVVFPFVLGYLYTLIIDHTTTEAMFIGAAMVATSVGITARVFADLGIIESRAARIILGAAVIDDVIGLIVLAIVTGLDKGTLSLVKIGLITLEAAAFIVFLIIVGRRIVHRVLPRVSKFRTKDAVFSLAILFCLLLSAVASYIDLAAIVGAFLAGMILSGLNLEFNLSVKTESLYNFLVPFFFVILGTWIDLSIFSQPQLLWAALIITIFAVSGKLLGCGLGALNLGSKEALIVGFGMVPRGEVGMIIASIGLRMGAITSDLYTVIIFMVMATTLMTPPILRKLVMRKPEEKPQEGEKMKPE